MEPANLLNTSIPQIGRPFNQIPQKCYISYFIGQKSNQVLDLLLGENFRTATSARVIKHLPQLDFVLIKDSSTENEIDFELIKNDQSNNCILFYAHMVDFQKIHDNLQTKLTFKEFTQKLESNESLELNETNHNKLSLIKVGYHENYQILALFGTVENTYLKNVSLSNGELNSLKLKIKQIYDELCKDNSHELCISYIYEMLTNINKSIDIPIDDIVNEFFANIKDEKETYGFVDHTLDQVEFDYDFNYHHGENVGKVPSFFTETGNFDWDHLKAI